MMIDSDHFLVLSSSNDERLIIFEADSHGNILGARTEWFLRRDPDHVIQTLNISNNGEITIQSTDGRLNRIGQVALANFSNPEGLNEINEIGGGVWGETDASGPPTVRAPATEGFGLLSFDATQ